jgi:hypothetical protein
LLLVIDDAWRIEAALAFKAGGPRCAYLMTTRFPPIALQFAPNDAITIPELIHNNAWLRIYLTGSMDDCTRKTHAIFTLITQIGNISS